MNKCSQDKCFNYTPSLPFSFLFFFCEIAKEDFEPDGSREISCERRAASSAYVVGCTSTPTCTGLVALLPWSGTTANRGNAAWSSMTHFRSLALVLRCHAGVFALFLLPSVYYVTLRPSHEGWLCAGCRLLKE